MNIFRVKLEKRVDGVYAVFGDNARQGARGQAAALVLGQLHRQARSTWACVPENIHDEQAVPGRLSGQHHRRVRRDRRADGFGNLSVPLDLAARTTTSSPASIRAPPPAAGDKITRWRSTPIACTSSTLKPRKPSWSAKSNQYVNESREPKGSRDFASMTFKAA